MALLPPRGSWRVKRETATPEPPVADDLLEPGTDALAVRIVVQQDGFVTGWDDGAMGFDEDAVWFSGRATSFRIVAADVFADWHDRRDAARLPNDRILNMGLPLRHPAREIYIRTAVLTVEGRKEWQDKDRLAMEIRRLWFLDRSAGESQYPPLLPRPGARVWEPGRNLATHGLASGHRSRNRLNLFVDIGNRMAHQSLLRALAEEGP